MSCDTAFVVVAFVPEKPMLRSRSTVDMVSFPKSISPLPRSDRRSRRFGLVLLSE
jgi:hypothetical protein